MTTLFKMGIGESEKGWLLQVTMVPFCLWLVLKFMNQESSNNISHEAKENMTKDISIFHLSFIKLNFHHQNSIVHVLKQNRHSPW